MIKNGYEEQIKIKYSETDQNLAMKPYALLNFLQDIASQNAEDLGFGYSFIKPKNYAWFLIKYRMEFEEYPYDIQELTLKTEPRGYNRLFAYRDFELFKGKKLLGRMHSMWSMVDIDSRSMIPSGGTQNVGRSFGVTGCSMALARMRMAANPCPLRFPAAPVSAYSRGGDQPGTLGIG